jgi:hypothetical protein
LQYVSALLWYYNAHLPLDDAQLYHAKTI